LFRQSWPLRHDSFMRMLGAPPQLVPETE